MKLFFQSFFTIILLVTVSLNTNAQLLSYELLNSYSTAELEVFIDDQGLPSGILVPEYEVDYYKITYLTPYLHVDSLVQASGAIAIPQNVACPAPILSYQHGTQSKRDAVASNQNGGQWEVGLIFSATGYIFAMPDYLGMGDKDPKVPIHPYTHAFSQAHTTLNMCRATRELCEAIGVEFNEQLFLSGYSQGGGATAAAQKLIEEEYSDEFQITATAPMSGVYDMIDVQVELIGSPEEYPTPGYLPYIILAYQSIFGNMYEDIAGVFKTPYDTIIPKLFYEGETSIGNINNQCTPVPMEMIVDTVVENFFANLNHPLRRNLAESHLLDWAPQNPVKLLYCQGDNQVTYLNSESAYDSWIENGATQVEKQDFGDFDHNDCAIYCFLATRNFFDSFAEFCVGVEDEPEFEDLFMYPNPTANFINHDLELPEYQIDFYNTKGQLVKSSKNRNQIDLSDLNNGQYLYQLSIPGSIIKTGNIVKLN